ncbi:MAG: hypothetical protein FWF03_06670, partial [Defluviitaleaceae bacterium]|nr:hypothetical protein [Defluviitaleaceae bacterium]
KRFYFFNMNSVCVSLNDFGNVFYETQEIFNSNDYPAVIIKKAGPADLARQAFSLCLMKFADEPALPDVLRLISNMCGPSVILIESGDHLAGVDEIDMAVNNDPVMKAREIYEAVAKRFGAD